METKYTHCDICLAACGMEVDVEDNRIVSLRGDVKHPLSRGFLCAKGMASHELTSDPLRLSHPYKRSGDTWKRIDWNKAYKEISSKLREISAKHGPNSIAMYYGAGNALSSMNYMMADGFMRALGSDKMFNVLTLEFTNRYLVMQKMYGKQFFVTQPDIDRTHCLLVFGSNPMVSLDHPGIVASLKNLKKRGAKLFVIDPRTTETAQMADIHADIIPGTDLFMLLAMYSYIFENDLQNSQFLHEHGAHYKALQDLEKLTPDAAEKICGVPADKIKQIAEEFARAESASAVCKLGINTSLHGTITYWLVEALNAVTGNLDKPGGLIFNPGVLDLNFLSRMAAGRKQRKSRIGGFPYLTGSHPASELSSEILMDTPDQIRALIVDAGDPALVVPDSRKFEDAAKKLDLLVSIDICMNNTAQMADYVLPAANFFEKDDLFVTFPEHHPFPFAQWRHKVVEPPDAAKPEWEIFRDLSRHMGIPILNQWPMELMFRGGAFLGKILGKPDSFSFNPKNYYKLLLGTMGKVSFGKLMKNPHGVKACDIKFGSALKRMTTPSRKADIAPPEFVAALKKVTPPQKNPEQYPLMLITGERSPYSKNTHIRNLKSLKQKQSGNFLRISSEDATGLSISDGNMVEVFTQNSSVEVPAKITNDIRPGVVSLPHGWGRKLFHPETQTDGELQGSNSNVLTETMKLDELSGMPIYNSMPCAVRKASD